MRRPQRLIAFTVLIALSGALAGCGGGGMSSFDPSDMLDFFDTKKKLPGERKPVFPEGVPGLEQGVPKNLYRGSRQEQIDQQNAEAAAATGPAAPPPQEPKSKRGAKGKQPGVASRALDAAQQPAAAPAPDAVPEEEGSTAAAPPAPKPKIVRRRTTAPPPDAPAQSAQPAQQSATPFPAPMPSGTFTR
jgi:predicted small lipoprotein YifL